MPKLSKDKTQNRYFSAKDLKRNSKFNFKISLKFVATIFLILIFFALFYFAISAKVEKFQVNGADENLNSQVLDYTEKYKDANYFFTFSSQVENDLNSKFAGFASIKVDKRFPDTISLNVSKKEIIAKVICQNYSALLGSDFEVSNKLEQPNFTLINNLRNSLTDNLNLENIELTIPEELKSNTNNSQESSNASIQANSVSSVSSSSISSETVETKILKFKAQELLKIKRNMYQDFFTEVGKLNLTNSTVDQTLPVIYCLDNFVNLEKFKELLTKESELLTVNKNLIVKNEEKIYIYSLEENLEIQNLRLNSVLDQIEKEKGSYKQIDLRENKVVVY